MFIEINFGLNIYVKHSNENLMNDPASIKKP